MSHSKALRAIAIILLALPVWAQAAESYDNCSGYIDSVPTYISQQGNWCLRKDLSTAITSGAAIAVHTNNVTIDCNDFKIGGLAGGPGTRTIGILSPGVNNTTVRNCNVRGFWIGIVADAGSGHLIEGNRLNGNVGAGISVYSPNSTVRNNFVFDTGGSTQSANPAQGIAVGDGVDVVDNTVSGVLSNDLQPDNDARGISAGANGNGSIVGNRVRGIVPSGAGRAFGIIDFTVGTSVIGNNIVQGLGQQNSTGIFCNSGATLSRDNVVSGFWVPVDRCSSYGDSFPSSF
jgi:hypothetical protein